MHRRSLTQLDSIHLKTRHPCIQLDQSLIAAVNPPTFTTLGMTHAILVSALIIALSCCERPSTSSPMSSPSEPDPVLIDTDDTEMNAAMQTARDQFPKFWHEVSQDHRRPIPALNAAMVKAYFHDKDSPKSGEHMWVTDIDYDGTTITGILADRPRTIQSVKPGEVVKFPLGRLSDWLYVDQNKAFGAFTVRLLRTRMTDEQRSAHDSHYPFAFD